MSYTSAKQRPSFTFDALLQLKDTGLVAASAAATVSSVAKIVTVGAGRFDARAIFDITAIEVDTGNELYSLEIQGSTSSTFATVGAVLAELQVGDSSVTVEAVDSATGRYELPFQNVQNNVYYPYIRLYIRVAGTIATGINLTAFIAKNNN